MRIEINAGGLGGALAVHDYLGDIDTLTEKSNLVITSFTTVKNKICNVTGGLGNLAEAVNEIDTRLRRDSGDNELAKEVRKKSDSFLDLAISVDKQVAKLVTKNQKEFFAQNPHLKPETFADAFLDWIKGAWQGLLMVKDAIASKVKQAYEGIKTAVENTKKWIQDTLLKIEKFILKLELKIHSIEKAIAEKLIFAIQKTKEDPMWLVRQIGYVANVIVDLHTIIARLFTDGGILPGGYLLEYLKKRYFTKSYEYVRENDVHPSESEYGTGIGTIPHSDYADLCWLTNEATSKGYTKEDIIKYIKGADGKNKFGGNRDWKFLPEENKLKNLTADDIEIIKTDNNLDVLILKLDDNNAIVLFGGTDPDAKNQYIVADDILTDLGIGAGLNNPWLSAQKSEAMSIIKGLEAQGYTNIQTSGHSLGGYIASYVAMNSDCVSECVAFDPPGFNDYELKNESKITTYIDRGSIVNLPGENAGDTKLINVTKNKAGGILPNHEIKYISEAFHKNDSVQKST